MAVLFSDFNEQYGKLCEVFRSVTKVVFKPGQEFVFEKQMAEVRPVKKDNRPFLGMSDTARAESNRIVQKIELEMLQKMRGLVPGRRQTQG